MGCVLHGYPVVIGSGFGEASRGEKMALRGTDPESYITEYTLVYEDNVTIRRTRLHSSPSSRRPRVPFSPTPSSACEPDTRNTKYGTRGPELQPCPVIFQALHVGSKPETRNPRPETRNPRPETRKLETETRNPEPEARNPRPGTRNLGPDSWNFSPVQSYAQLCI